MSRTFRRESQLVFPASFDPWVLAGHIESFAAGQLLSWGNGVYLEGVEAADTAGSVAKATVSDARAALDDGRYVIKMIRLNFREDPEQEVLNELLNVGTDLDVQQWHHAHSREIVVVLNGFGGDDGTHPTATVVVQGPDEAGVAGIAQVVSEEVRRYTGQQRQSPARAISGQLSATRGSGLMPRTAGRLRHMVSSNWTITVVGGMIASIVAALVIALILGI